MIGEGLKTLPLRRVLSAYQRIFSTPERYAQLLAARTAGETVWTIARARWMKTTKWVPWGGRVRYVYNLAAATSTGDDQQNYPGGG